MYKIIFRKNLAALAFPDAVSDYGVKTLLVLKASNPYNIERFENLLTQKACFPEYGGIGE